MAVVGVLDVDDTTEQKAVSLLSSWMVSSAASTYPTPQFTQTALKTVTLSPFTVLATAHYDSKQYTELTHSTSWGTRSDLPVSLPIFLGRSLGTRLT